MTPLLRRIFSLSSACSSPCLSAAHRTWWRVGISPRRPSDQSRRLQDRFHIL